MSCGMLRVYLQSAYCKAAWNAPYCLSGGSRLLPGAPLRYPRCCCSHATLCRTLSERISHFPAPPALQSLITTGLDSLGKIFPSHASVPDQAQSVVLTLMLQLHRSASLMYQRALPALASATQSWLTCSPPLACLTCCMAGNECRDILWHSIAYGLKR